MSVCNQIITNNRQMDQHSFDFFMDHCQISPEFTQTGCTILHNTISNQLVLMKEIDLHYDDNVDNMIQILLKQKELYHDHLLSLIDFYPALEEGKMVKFYEYCSHTLLQEIESRAETNNPFTEEELENILVSGLKLLQYLEQSEIGHGCVSPLDICLADDMVKIVDPSIASSNPLSISEGYYYAPEMMQCITKGNDDEIDIFKNDVFSLAVCILHCGLLNSCHDCYDYERGEFIFEFLEEKIAELNQIYSEKLVKILIRMLDEDYLQRPNAVQLLGLIEKEYEQEQQNQKTEEQYETEQQYQQTQQHENQLYQAQQKFEYQSDAPYYQQQQSQYYQPGQIKQEPPRYEYAVEESLNCKQNALKSKASFNENNSSLSNISKTEERLASMINRAKMNISKMRQNNNINHQ